MLQMRRKDSCAAYRLRDLIGQLGCCYSTHQASAISGSSFAQPQEAALLNTYGNGCPEFLQSRIRGPSAARNVSGSLKTCLMQKVPESCADHRALGFHATPNPQHPVLSPNGCDIQRVTVSLPAILSVRKQVRPTALKLHSLTAASDPEHTNADGPEAGKPSSHPTHNNARQLNQTPQQITLTNNYTTNVVS